MIYSIVGLVLHACAQVMERDALLKQADHMWKMLDNMAEHDPEGYQRFIKKQLQEGATHLQPPQPVFCLSCEIDEVCTLVDTSRYS